MLIDSHAHLDMDDFADDRDEVIERAFEGGVKKIISVGIDLDSSLKALDLAKRFDFIYSTIGYHPHDADKVTSERLYKLKDLAKEKKVVAWGEIGLDFFKNRSKRERQIEVFTLQLKLAHESNLPVIIHNRDADREVLNILSGLDIKRHCGVIHCFSGDYETANAFMDMGYYISIPGIVTFKNAEKLKEVAAGIPLDRMLVETDAPFLAPVPKRGKRNEPLFVKYTAKMIADLRGIDFEELSSKTVENCNRLFNLM